MMPLMDSDIETAIAWYDQSEWTTWRRVCSDGETFFSIPYDTWLELATTTKNDQESLGRTVTAVPIKLANFLRWAEENERGTGPDDRSAFTAFCAAAFAS